jgi:hypothetical protein
VDGISEGRQHLTPGQPPATLARNAAMIDSLFWPMTAHVIMGSSRAGARERQSPWLGPDGSTPALQSDFPVGSTLNRVVIVQLVGRPGRSFDRPFAVSDAFDTGGELFGTGQ